MIKPYLKKICCSKQVFRVVLVEKRREEDMLSNLIYLFIYSYIINYIVSNAFFTFHNAFQRVFLRFFSS